MASSRLKTNIASFLTYPPPTHYPPTNSPAFPPVIRCSISLSLRILHIQRSKMRGTSEPAYPSFSLVLSCADNDTRRPPSCREGHRRRYHPYSSKPRRQPANNRMNMADYRYEDAFRVAATLLAYTPNAAAGHEAQDVGNLNHAPHPTDMPKRRQKLSDLIAHFALTTRRRIARMGVLQKWTFPARFDFTS
ncbi:hypothetical protein WOLCODRAFT_138827 [Wolfiporia cocos MD-104 SS10]|uniref:Uncharacterized protein n=1 Tax=Wolfiporia cocos (strain MD-104) TaxID=742152 RepID=A0A2H3JW37_WOLCO|nr:hypothetical protein WOLCODRAFT_138827 [Wolfiporia cocos MD-104 SS10]